MLAAQSRKFRYLADPLFLGAVMLYALNRWWWKPRFGDALPFLHDHFNDCLLIPVALPPLLWIFRKCRLRAHDEMPTVPEVLEWTVVWSVVFEWIFPRFFRLGTADWGDVLSYMAGAVLSAGFWFKKVC
jgi:hypothetical protein